MVALFICMGIFLLVFALVFLFVALDSIGNWEVTLALGASLGLFVAAFLSGLHATQIDNKARNHQHVQALHQLQQRGWNIKDSNVDIDGHVTVGCFKFTLKKIAGRYHVTAKRNKNAGGGYTILRPKDQRFIKTICVNQNTDNSSHKTAIRSMARDK